MTQNQTEQAPQETPEQTIERAQEIINTLRDHLQSATDALVGQQVENKLIIRHVEAQNKEIERLTALVPVEPADEAETA